MSRFAARLYSALQMLGRRKVRWGLLALGVLLCTPAMLGGLVLDDYILLDQLLDRTSGEGAGRSPLDLFVFVDGDPARNSRLMDTGSGLAWWTYEHAKGAFFRPLTSLTHLMDVWAWPDVPALMYAHSLVWLALVLGMGGLAYTELVRERWVAGLAFALFALDEAHGQTAGWIANRSALLATTFAIGALIAHHRARTRPHPVPYTVLAVVLLGTGLLAGEFAIGILGYLFAYAAMLERGPRLRRLVSLWPYAALVLIWRVGYTALGYGTHGLGSYLDPLHSPVGFLTALPRRWVLLMSSQLGGQPADLATLLNGPARAGLIVLAVIGVLIAVWLVWPTLVSRRESRFWAVGAALSAIPVSATWPSDRLLLLVGLGVMPLLAYVIHDVLVRLRRSAEGIRLRGAVVFVVLVVNLVVAPIQLPVRAMSMAKLGGRVEAANRSLPADLDGRTVVITTVPTSIFASYIQVMRSVRGQPRPAHVHWLTEAASPVDIRRVGPRTLRVEPQDGFLDTPWARHYRDARLSMPRGHRVHLATLTVEVVELTADGRPAACDFHFHRPLDSPQYVWQRWDGDGFAPFEPPPLDTQITLPSDPMPYLGRATANKNSGVNGVSGRKGVPSSPAMARKRP